MSGAATAGAAMRAWQLVLAPGSQPFDIELREGEVLGLAGLEGHGQERLLEVLSGQAEPHAGRVEVGRDAAAGPRTLREAFAQRIVYVPRDRKTQGILPALSVLDNFAVATLREDRRLGVLRSSATRDRYERFARRLGIVAASGDQRIGSLSGGNQQKVLLARWLAAQPRVLLLNDPSRGVDHRTRLSLHTIYREVAAEGAAVVLLSTEIEELLSVADEIVVFRDQCPSARLSGDERTQAAVLAAMFGGHDER